MDQAQQKIGCFVRLMTTRSVCMALVLGLCLLSALLTLSNFSFDSGAALYTVSPRKGVYNGRRQYKKPTGLAKKRVDGEEAFKRRKALNKNLEAVFKRLEATSGRRKDIDNDDDSVKKLFEVFEENRMHQQPDEKGLYNTTDGLTDDWTGGKLSERLGIRV